MSLRLVQSQTQGGTRHTPELTRFYTGHGCFPEQFISLAFPVLKGMGFRCRQPEIVPKASDSGTGSAASVDSRRMRMKIMGVDARNAVLRGDMEVEMFDNGCFVVMRREAVRYIVTCPSLESADGGNLMHVVRVILFHGSVFGGPS